MKRLLLSLLVLFLNNSIFAVQVKSIYQASIPVASQSSEDRNQALPEALKQVLVKVSGKATLLDNPNLKSKLSNASNFIQEYGYVDASAAVTSKPYLLKVRFEPEDINKMLQEMNLPIWGQDRPLILAWVEYEMQNQPAVIIDGNSSQPIQALIKQASDERGLPILFPTMDMTDMNVVLLNDIVTMALPTLQKASERYNSDAMLIVRLFQNPQGYSTQAKLVLNNDSWDWNLTENTLGDVIHTLMNNVADTLASRYSTVVKNTIQKNLTLKIIGITQEDDFAQVMRYLQHIAVVADVQLVQVDGTAMTLMINLRGTQDALVQALALDKKFTAIAGESTLTYQWNH